MFNARFAGGLDIGVHAVVKRFAEEHGVGTAMLNATLADGTAAEDLVRSQAAAHRLGVSGTPAWAAAGRLLVGLQSREALASLASPLRAVEFEVGGVTL